MNFHGIKIGSIVFSCAVLFLLISTGKTAEAQFYVGKTRLEKRSVLDSATFHFPRLVRLVNGCYTLTKDYVIKDELLFSEDEKIPDDDVLYETERNLRNLGIFQSVSIEVDSVGSDIYDIYVNTRDAWSSNPSLLVGTGGDADCIGGRLEEINLFGTNTYVMGEALHRSENGINWQYRAAFRNPSIFRTGLGISASMMENDIRHEQYLTVFNEFRNTDDKYYYNLTGANRYGKEYIYDHGENHTNDRLLEYSREQKLSAVLARAWKNDVDIIYISTLLELQKADRGDKNFTRAYDNMGRILIAFSSSQEDWVPLTKVNKMSVEDVPIGGWGSAILGKIFQDARGGGKGMFYTGGQVERSYLSFDKKFYAFGSIYAGSSFRRADGYNTYVESNVKSFYQISDNFTFAQSMRQQTVWNWGNNYRQLLLDNENGVRGFKLNQLRGDNRIYNNTELRWYPDDLNLIIYKVGAVAFWDAGTVWNRNRPFSSTQWKNSAGVGLRFYSDANGEVFSCFRLDLAFDLTDKKFGEIIFSTNQAFSAFGIHAFDPPKVFGTDFDYD